MTNFMSGPLESIITGILENERENNPALDKAMRTKSMEDCVSAVFNAFYSIAKQQGNCALGGDDALIGSAAIHWFTEDKPTHESIVEILKSGTTAYKASKNTSAKESKADKPKKADTKKVADKKATTKKATVPTKSAKGVLPVKKAPVIQVCDDDDDVD